MSDASIFLRRAIDTGEIPLDVVMRELALRGYVTVKDSSLLYECGRCFKRPKFPRDSETSEGEAEVPVSGSRSVWV
jgi:hypothetical protein